MAGEEEPIELFSSKPKAKRLKKASAQASAPDADVATAAQAPEASTSHVAAQAHAPAAEELPAGDTEMTFRQLGLSEWLDRVCAGLGMRQPTQVQRGTIPAVLAGRNVIGVAHTGSGKTAAFALPILQRLAKDPYGVFALVLTPTRCGQGHSWGRRGRRRRAVALANHSASLADRTRVPCSPASHPLSLAHHHPATHPT